MGEDQSQTGRQRFTVAEASEILGVTVEAVRGRIKRGTLDHERTDKGVFVLLDANQSYDRLRPDTDQATDRLQSDSSTLISAKDETIATLRDQLEAERQAHAEARRLLMAALERIPPQLEAPTAPSEPRESPETPSDTPGNTTGTPRTGAARRSAPVVAARVRWIDSTGGGGARGVVDRGTRAVSWFGTPEAQATIIVGILTVIAQPLFLLVAFFFGKAQGRAQVRQERAADAVVAAVRVVADLRTEVGMWAIERKRDESESKYRGTILRLRQELRDLVYDNSPWLDPKTERKLKPVINELKRQYDAHNDALASGDAARITETGERLAEWNTRNLTQMQLDLEDEARRLIGSKRHWTLTWWGKLLAWFTRTTRFFVARNWIRRNLGWLAAVPGTALATALATFVIYFLVAR